MNKSDSINKVKRGVIKLCRVYISKPGAGVFLALLAFMAAVAIIAPEVSGGSFLIWSNIVNVLRQQTYIGIIACAMTLIVITGNIDLSVGSQLTLLTVLCAQFSKTMGNFAIPLTLVLGIVCGAFNAFTVCGLRLNAFISTLASGSIFGSLTLILKSGNTIRADSALFDFIGSGNLFGLVPMPVVILLIVVVAFAFILSRTVFGRRLFAIGANPTAARLSGVKCRREVAVTYMLCGLCCGLAASLLIARSVSASPQIGASKEMDVILAVILGGTSILGGKGSVWGTVVGFLFIGFMNAGFTFLAFNQYMQWIVMGAILVAALALDIFGERGARFGN